MNETDKQATIEQIESGAAILVAKWHYEDIFEVMDWMIRELDNENDGESIPSKVMEMKKAKRVRDIVGMDFKVDEPPPVRHDPLFPFRKNVG